MEKNQRNFSDDFMLHILLGFKPLKQEEVEKMNIVSMW